MLNPENTCLVVVDVQGKLAEQMADSWQLFQRINQLVAGAKILQIPILLLEQLPEKLGPTHQAITRELEGIQAISKSTFSGAGSDEFNRQLANLDKHQVVICGIESHICVYQTSSDLLGSGYGVHLVTDCTSSRTEHNRELGIRKIEKLGAQLTSVEMLLFELQGHARGQTFRDLLKIIK